MCVIFLVFCIKICNFFLSIIMVMSCVAYKCNNVHDKRYNVQFHSFPFKRPDILKLWVKAIRRVDWKPTKFSKLCSEHFLGSDYLNRPGTVVKFLKPDAIPSIFDFQKRPVKYNVGGMKLKRCLENTNEEKVCRLCLTTISSNSDVVDEVAENMIEVLLLNPDLSATLQPIMCTSCVEKLQRFFHFKTTCVQANDPLRYPSVDDINTDYVCRLCKQYEKKELFISISVLEKKSDLMREMLVKCLPELNFCFVADFVICRHCLDSLNGYFSFMMACRCVEEKIKEYRKTEGEGVDHQLKLEKIVQKFSSKIELTNVGQHNNVDVIKNEDGLVQNDEMMGAVIKDECLVTEEQDFKAEVDECAVENDRLFDNSIPQPTERPSESSKLSPVHIFKCDLCSYESKYKAHLVRHLLVHKDISSKLSPVHIFKCDLCSYESKHKAYLTRHLLVHKDVSEITMYQCEICPFKTKERYRLKKHELTHKGLSEVTTFKCNLCPYEARSKVSLKRHLLIHKDRSTMTMYHCEKCPYKTIRRNHIRSHLLRHETKTYKCESCPYETRQRTFFIKHLSVHKSRSKMTVYDCEKCSYKTTRKAYHKLHQLTHKDISEITAYKCDLCPYEGKRKQQLTKHMFVHKDKSEITIFKGELCPYEAKRKFQVTLHMLQHKNWAKMENSEKLTSKSIC